MLANFNRFEPIWRCEVVRSKRLLIVRRFTLSIIELNLCRRFSLRPISIGTKPRNLNLLETKLFRQNSNFFKLPRHFSSYSKKSNSYQYCVDLVRRLDYENYLCTLLLAPKCRRVSFVIRAFNCELAQISDQTSSKMAGLGRLQFWTDVVNKIFDQRQPYAQPVAIQLDRVGKFLNKKWLLDMIQARSANFGDSGFDTVRQLEDYYQKTLGSCLFLILQSMSVQDVQADHAASHVAKAVGIVNCLRSTPLMAGRNKVLIPNELLMHHNVSQEMILRSNRDSSIKNLVHDLAGQANVHLEHARKLKSKLPKGVTDVFLCVSIVDYYLKLFQQIDFDLFDPMLARSKNVWLPYGLLWRKVRRTF